MTQSLQLAIYACLAGSMALASCTSASDSGIAFESRTDSCAYVTPDLYGDTVYSIAYYKMVWPVRIGNNDLSGLHDSLLTCTFDTIAADFSKAAEHFFRKGPVDGLELPLLPANMEQARKAEKSNELVSNGYISLLTPELIVFGIDNYGYLYGAAHGYGTSDYINYSIADNSILTAANLFEPDKTGNVVATVRNAARELYPGGEVNPDEITDISTFRISPRQIIFVFQPYDIAPYSMGVVEIPVQTYDLYEAFSPLGHKVLGI